MQQIRFAINKQLKLFFPLFFLFLYSSTLALAATDDFKQQIETLAKKLAFTAHGDVLKGTESEVYINLGRRDGILPGSKFEIIRQGEPLKVGDEVIGYEETRVAEVVVEKAREKISICKILTKSDAISIYKILTKSDVPKIGLPKKGDKVYQQRKKINTLVVGQFTYNNNLNGLTKNMQEMIVTAMANTGMQVVERAQLERVLKEQKLGYSGLLNINTVKKIGGLLGAEGILLGTISDMGNNITINARMVDIESGKTLSASAVELPKTPLVSRLLGIPVEEESFVKSQGGLSSGSGTKTSMKSVQKVDIGDFTIHLKQCKRTAANVKCEILIVNNGEDKDLEIIRRNLRLIDNLGRSYGPPGENNVFIGNEYNNHCYNSIKSSMVKGIPIRAGVVFENVDRAADSIALVEFSFNGFPRVQFRNIKFD